MRVGLYARYSSDQQRDESITDQLGVVRARIATEGWTEVQAYDDAAISGASMIRPGIQRLMRDALAGKFDVVMAESLDRFSRDQADVATMHKRLAFVGVKILTLAEGEIGPLHIGLKGTMNSMFLSDLADKTRRGLRGRAEAGKWAGGLCYGYRKVRVAEGEPRGEQEVVLPQAEVVRRIFRAYNTGMSPKAIAKWLNAEKVPPPRASAWSPSTILGNATRGTGILNNALYVGRYVWNRQHYRKNPETGKRVARINQEALRSSVSVPHLRILDDDTWQATKARQAVMSNRARDAIVYARRPKHLFSELTKCGSCGGGFTLSSHDRLTCFNSRSRGTCSNRRGIKRQELEARVLHAIRARLFEPGAFREFCAAFTAEMTRLRREHIAETAGARRELATVERRQREIMNALAEGYRSEAWKADLVELDHRKAKLTSALAEPPLPALHPKMADAFRAKVETLALGLEHDEQRHAARLALRGLIDKIVVPPNDGLLKVVGNLGAMLETAHGRTQTGTDVAIVGCGGGI